MAKKWGILIKKESESLIFTGLKIPRDYKIIKGGEKMKRKIVKVKVSAPKKAKKITICSQAVTND